MPPSFPPCPSPLLFKFVGFLFSETVVLLYYMVCVLCPFDSFLIFFFFFFFFFFSFLIFFFVAVAVAVAVAEPCTELNTELNCRLRTQRINKNNPFVDEVAKRKEEKRKERKKGKKASLCFVRPTW
ncbi:predicted protein [Sclerotinia sclerotiorum 1980 UF-70]|uniref:Uncharacterized protein n=1 Tax=Sclerotinia sclerotiorum (strain ATCC 18683 / 1980 / Ss-1) TaxID=665079 RepID=A7F5F1_SCLS1|nr:predicted protein [Sclerotinia sclerotiorum 1980 UF-70]EDN97972.1 predicted protein [Sclerotinia sclerotiorum 1980 UF-70]